MKRTYKTPKAIHVDFHYDVQIKAASSDVAPYGDPNRIGYCQQSSPFTCTYFWIAGTTVCQANPLRLWK